VRQPSKYNVTDDFLAKILTWASHNSWPQIRS